MSGDDDNLLVRGDEFALDDYESLRDIQISSEHRVGAAASKRASKPKPSEQPPEPSVSSADEIEVYDEKSRTLDLYSINDIDRMRALMQEFAGDLASATLFNRIIKQAAHVRAAFRTHDDTPAIMARQLVIIGQDPALYGARIVIPTVHPIEAESMMDRLRRTNPQISQTHSAFRPRKSRNVAPKISLPPTKSAQRAATARSASAEFGVQFPSRVLARIRFPGSTAEPTLSFIAPNTSVVIESLEIHNPFAQLARDAIIDRGIPWQFMLFDAIGIQEDTRPPAPADIARDPPIRTIPMDAPDVIAQCARIFAYLNLAFAHLHEARAIPRMPPSSPSADSDFEPLPQRATIDVAQLSASDERLLAGAQALGDLTLDFTYPSSVVLAISSESSYELFWKLMFPTIPIGKITHAIEAQRELRTRARHVIDEHKSNMRRLEILAGIIEDNFGSAKLPSLKATQAAGPNVGFVRVIVLGTTREDVLLSKLSPPERKFVLAKFTEMTGASAASANLCEHVAIVRKLDAAVNSRAISAILEQLAPFINDPSTSNATTMIPCKRCKQDAICPHKLEAMRARAANATRQQERDIMFKYLERVPDRRVFYCRICGEVFTWELVTSEDTEQAVAENEELASLIFRELMIMQRYVRARVVVDQMVFLRTVERHIYPFLEAIENRTALTQTSAAAELAAKLRVFIAIYIFADCIVNAERYNIVFDGYTARDAKPGITPHVIKYAIDKIVSIENVQLRQVAGMTREVISANMITAIAQLRDVSSEMPFEKEKRADYRIAVAYDPIYCLYYQFCIARSRAKRTGGAKPKQTKPHASAPVARLMPPGRAPHELAVFDLMPEKPRDPRNIYADLFSHCATSREKSSAKGVIIENIKRGLALRSFDFPRSTANRAIVEYLNRVDAINAQLRADEHARFGARFKNRIIPSARIIRAESETISPDSRDVKLSRIFDEKGRAHSWNILIFAPTSPAPAPAPSDQVEFKFGDASGFGDPKLHYVTTKCSTCGILRADLIEGRVQFDDARVASALRERESLTSLYRFFETRCPLGNNHDIPDSSTGICARCGYSPKLARDLDVEWGAKYAPAFREFTHGETIATTQPNAAPRRIVPNAEYIESAAQALATRAWAFNYDIVASVASTFKVERADLLALGAHEGVSREQLADGSFVARVPKSRYDVRIQTLRAYLSDISMWYGVIARIPSREKVRGHSLNVLVEDFKRAMLQPQGPFTSIAQLDENITAMPKIATLLARAFDVDDAREFPSVLSRAFDIFAATRKPMEIVNYFTESLCRILLALRDPASECATTLARIAIDRILAMESTSLKSEHFDLSIVEGTKLASEEFEVAVADTIAASISDAINADEDEETTAVDPLSLDAFDVDDAREDNMDEDEQTFIHIGDEHGW